MRLLRPDHPLQAVIHWHKALIARRSVRALSELDIPWVVIVPWNYALDEPGWDYHLIKRDWGYGVAERYLKEGKSGHIGGWVLTLDPHEPKLVDDESMYLKPGDVILLVERYVTVTSLPEVFLNRHNRVCGYTVEIKDSPHPVLLGHKIKRKMRA